MSPVASIIYLIDPKKESPIRWNGAHLSCKIGPNPHDHESEELESLMLALEKCGGEKLFWAPSGQQRPLLKGWPHKRSYL